MAVLLGRLDQFEPEQEEWPQYVERLVQFFEANDITGDNKAAKCCATFLSVIGPVPYKLLRSLIAPTKPTNKTFKELVAVLTEHYSPQPSEVMQRFHFNSRLRKEGESACGRVRRRTTSSGQILSFRNYLGQDAPGPTHMGH